MLRSSTAEFAPATGTRPRIATRIELVAAMLCLVAWNLWMFATTGRYGPRMLLAFGILELSFLLWGRLTLVLLSIDRLAPRTFLFPLALGAIEVLAAVAAVRLLTPVPLSALLLGQLALAAILTFALRRRLADWLPLPRLARRELATLVLILVAITAWLQHLVPLLSLRGAESFYRPHIEAFFHTARATPMLIEGTPVELGSFHFAGEPLTYYHYASYALPASLAALTGCPAYDAMVGAWYPIGFFLVGAAAWVLGSVLWRPAVGFWCAVAVVVLPDPTFWFSRFNFLSFDALAEASPAGSYATCATALAVTVMTLAVRSRRLSLVGASLALAAATVFYKANFAIAALPFCSLYFLAAWRHFGTARMAPAAGALALVGAASVFVGTRLSSGPTLKLDPDFGQAYTQLLLDRELPRDGWLQRFRPWVGHPNLTVAVPARAALIATATFQGFLIPVLVAHIWALVAWPSARLRHVLFPLVFILYLAAGVGLAPNQNGDPFELQHRIFVWVYAFAGVCTTAILMRLPGAWIRRPIGANYAAGFALLTLPLLLGGNAYVAPHETVPTGLVRAGEFIREHSYPHEIAQDSLNDAHLYLSAISQRRAYVCISTADPYPGSGRLAALHASRARETQALLDGTSITSLADYHRRTGVRWFVLHPESRAAWPAEILAQPAFESYGYRVYDLSDLPSVGK
ncbi:MAG: hypothetical protein K2Y37_10765 [Pirellulales bacterium]|nr:hypothetical protein [Pirellulales bacterium]